MTLSSSWSFCMDIGGERSGAVSGAMNMVGNLGAAFSAVAFPYFVSNITIPILAPNLGNANSFFVFAAAINVLAVIAWCFMNPLRELQLVSKNALKLRFVIFLGMMVLVLGAVLYTQILMK